LDSHIPKLEVVDAKLTVDENISKVVEREDKNVKFKEFFEKNAHVYKVKVEQKSGNTKRDDNTKLEIKEGNTDRAGKKIGESSFVGLEIKDGNVERSDKLSVSVLETESGIYGVPSVEIDGQQHVNYTNHINLNSREKLGRADDHRYGDVKVEDMGSANSHNYGDVEMTYDTEENKPVYGNVEYQETLGKADGILNNNMKQEDTEIFAEDNDNNVNVEI
jgi:hypothetical protein